MLLALFALLSQNPSMAELMRGFSDDHLEVRSRAARHILEAWKAWTEADLALLRGAKDSGDAEVREQAKECLSQLEMYRGLPESIWRALPEAGPALARGTPDQASELASKLISLWQSSRVGSRDTMAVLVRLSRDGRELTEGGTVQGEVRPLIQEIVPRLNSDLPQEELECWWEENRGKTEVEWLLPTLDSPQERLRAHALGRLFQVAPESLRPKLFQELGKIEEGYSFFVALQALPALPKQTALEEFRRYLKDRRLMARFEAAKILMAHDPGSAIGSLIDALEHPQELNVKMLHSSQVSQVIHWIVGQKDERIIPALRTVLFSSPEREVRESALLSLGGLDDPQVSDILAEALWDAACTQGSEMWGHIHNPRICDEAGILLARRLNVEASYDWGPDYPKRDRNLRSIWNLYRERKRLPAAPFLPAGVTPADPARISQLVTDLASGDSLRCRSARKELSELGLRAWGMLQDEVGQRPESERDRLQASLRAVQNSVTSVEGSGPAEAAVAYLREHLHEPLDLGVFFHDFVESWFGDREIEGMTLEFKRDTLGRGVSLNIAVTAAPPGTPPFSQISFNGTGIGGSTWRFHKKALETEWGAFGQILEAEFDHVSGVTWAGTFRMVKVNYKN